MVERLFVYGTLRPGQSNAHLLSGIDGDWEAACVSGTLREGWCEEKGYPGLDLDARGTDVAGLVLTSAELLQHWAALDAFEGDEYQRVITTATLGDGRTVDAYVYVLRVP